MFFFVIYRPGDGGQFFFRKCLNARRHLVGQYQRCLSTIIVHVMSPINVSINVSIHVSIHVSVRAPAAFRSHWSMINRWSLCFAHKLNDQIAERIYDSCFDLFVLSILDANTSKDVYSTQYVQLTYMFYQPLFVVYVSVNAQ